MWEGGAQPTLIQRQGRWKSDSYWLYARDNYTSRAQAGARAFDRAKHEDFWTTS